MFDAIFWIKTVKMRRYLLDYNCIIETQRSLVDCNCSIKTQRYLVENLTDITEENFSPSDVLCADWAG